MNRGDNFIIENKQYSSKSLISFCNEQVDNNNTPIWKRKIYEFILNWLDDNQYIIQFSSGTTGRQKRLKLLKSSMFQSAINTSTYFQLQPGQNALLCLPVDYIAGKMMIVRAFVTGLNLYFLEPSSTLNLSEIGNIDFCAMVPLQVYNNINRINEFKQIRKLIIGGAEINDDLVKKLSSIPVEVYATYGMAETCSHVAVRRINGQVPSDFYKAMTGVKFSSDHRGCLNIHADFLPLGLTTNDVVELIDETRFRWIGRFDNLINSGGIKIIPEELEKIIHDATGLTCIVTGIDDNMLGKKIVVVFEKKDDNVSIQELELILIETLTKKNRPKKILVFDKLPRNDSYKIDRKVIENQVYEICKTK